VKRVVLGMLALLVAHFAARAANAQQRDEKEREGAEFIDTPGDAKTSEETPSDAANDAKRTSGYVPGYRGVTGVGLSPHAPQRFSSLPGGLTPSFGSPVPSRAFRFDFHGYLQVPMRLSIGKRERPTGDQKSTTFHGDPVVAGGSYGWFDHTRTVPTPWVQLNFSYGNEDVTATAIVGAWNIGESMEAAGYFQPPSQVWINDAFLTFSPRVHDVIRLKLDVGAFPDRYGAMAEYENGAYGTPLIAQIDGIGTTLRVDLPFEYDIDVHLEAGFKGDLDRVPVGVVPDASNEYARPEEGSTYAAHAHVGAGWKQTVSLALHGISSFTQDDRSDPADDPTTLATESKARPDGNLRVLGADFRVAGKRFGHFYAGAAQIDGEHAITLSNLVRILNSGGGKELMERYWGYASGGNGSLRLVGGQYSVSLGTLLRYPMEFWGEGPDLVLSAFGIYGDVDSEADAFDRKMLKYGVEATYSMLPWLAASGRIDHVMPELGDSAQSFAVISPKLVFRSDWQTRESITVQYAGYVLGNEVIVRGDNRLLNSPSGNPDRHLIAVIGTMWW
jgi:hypothetical protein